MGSDELRGIKKAGIVPGLCAFYYHHLTVGVC